MLSGGAIFIVLEESVIQLGIASSAGSSISTTVRVSPGSTSETVKSCSHYSYALHEIGLEKEEITGGLLTGVIVNTNVVT